MIDRLERRPLYVAAHRGEYRGTVFPLLEAAGLEGLIMGSGRGTVLIKPNLVGTHGPPVTTPVELVDAVAGYVRERCPGTKVVVGDGTGSLDYTTWKCFDELGYRALEPMGVSLTDLNEERLVRLERPGLSRWPEFHMPGLVMDSFLISVPMLKAHTLAEVTLSMKNMVGVAPPAHYQCGGRWKKSSFHERMHESILDLNRYRSPDFTVLDATVGMRDAHLWGPTLDTPPGLVVAGADPVAADAFGADLLGRDYNHIAHIADADGELGFTEPSSVERLS